MKEINLSKGKVALIDDEDYYYLNQFKWSCVKIKNNYYAIRGVGGRKNRKYELMHRVIMKAEKSFEVDHIDHDGLNNQKSNLRNCTVAENRRNRVGYGKSKYLGVCLFTTQKKKKLKSGEIKIYTYKQKYLASITLSGKKKSLGLYENEIDAAKAYDAEAKLNYGEFANLNFK